MHLHPTQLIVPVQGIQTDLAKEYTYVGTLQLHDMGGFRAIQLLVLLRDTGVLRALVYRLSIVSRAIRARLRLSTSKIN